jgi:hypothetical protein
MRTHRALAALQILSSLALAHVAHAQEALAARPAAASATPAPASAPAAPLAAQPARRRVDGPALAVALEPVTLAPDAKVDPELEADCRFEEIVGVDVGKMLHHYHLGGGRPTGGDARVLRIAVTDVSGSSGGVYSGTKSIRVHATLLIDGKVDRETDIYRYNVGGNPFRGTCHIFRQHTRRLGKDMASWIKDANYKVDDLPVEGKDDAE